MPLTVINDTKIKNLFKQAIVEAIEEKKDIVHDLFMDAMEDIALTRAIEEGENTVCSQPTDISCIYCTTAYDLGNDELPATPSFRQVVSRNP